MNDHIREHVNYNDKKLPAGYASIGLIVTKQASPVGRWVFRVTGSLFVLLLLFGYLWSIRPVYHSPFYRLATYSERDGIALLVFDSIFDTGNWVTFGVGDRRHMLVHVETGRQIRLSYSPWRNYQIVNLVSGDLVVIRNPRNNQVALMDINTRRKAIPFGRYDGFWDFRGDLALVFADDYMGVVNILTMKEVLPLNYYRIRFIYDTDRYVAITKRFIEFDMNNPYRWGVLCMYTHELLTPLVYDDRIWYQDGKFVMRQSEGVKLVDLANNNVIVPIGEFVSIIHRGYGVAEVRCSWGNDFGIALIDLSTGNIKADFGQFDLFSQINSYGVRVRQSEDELVRWGTFCLDALTVTWDDDLTYEELSMMHERFFPLQRPFAVPYHLAYYDQVRILSNGWALVRDGDYSWFTGCRVNLE